MERDAAIGRHREPGLDLLQIETPVLGMPVTDDGEILVLALSREGSVHGHAGHVPVHSGHIDPELTDRPRPDRARDVPRLRSDRIQCPGRTIIVEQTGPDPEDLLHRQHLARSPPVPAARETSAG